MASDRMKRIDTKVRTGLVEVEIVCKVDLDGEYATPRHQSALREAVERFVTQYTSDTLRCFKWSD